MDHSSSIERDFSPFDELHPHRARGVFDDDDEPMASPMSIETHLREHTQRLQTMCDEKDEQYRALQIKHAAEMNEVQRDLQAIREEAIVQAKARRFLNESLQSAQQTMLTSAVHIDKLMREVQELRQKLNISPGSVSQSDETIRGLRAQLQFVTEQRDQALRERTLMKAQVDLQHATFQLAKQALIEHRKSAMATAAAAAAAAASTSATSNQQSSRQ